MNAPEIAGPSSAGAARFWSTWIRPITVPMMPTVGAKPPAVVNRPATCAWRAARPSISDSRIACTRSESVPSTTSCRPLRVKASSILATSSSRASRPLRRAFSDSSTIWPMAPAESIDRALERHDGRLGRGHERAGSSSTPSWRRPCRPTIRISAGMLRNVTGFVPSMIAARNSAPNAHCDADCGDCLHCLPFLRCDRRRPWRRVA